ncbi:hypothetical protein PHG01_00036 [Streptococcus mutans PKUSS-HG01]|nr:hypothetical protein PHG01_00036 [Streptococcus mutans PKUSS-HG01]
MGYVTVVSDEPDGSARVLEKFMNLVFINKGCCKFSIEM